MDWLLIVIWLAQTHDTIGGWRQVAKYTSAAVTADFLSEQDCEAALHQIVTGNPKAQGWCFQGIRGQRRF